VSIVAPKSFILLSLGILTETKLKVFDDELAHFLRESSLSGQLLQDLSEY